jgi:integrase
VKALICASLLKSKAAQPREKPFDIRDTRLIGFILRVQPSGVRSYNVAFGDSRVAIGKVGALTPDEARERAQKALGNIAHGRPPLYGIDGATTESTGPTLEEFLKGTYEPWLMAHRPRRADKTIGEIRAHFAAWLPRPLASITVEDVESWRIKRLKEGGPKGRPTKAVTLTRYLTALAGLLTRAVKLKKLRENVVRQVERPRLDRSPKVRFLDASEESRLRASLDAGGSHARRLHLRPAVLLSMNTGVRRGELLALTWDDVMLTGENPHITVHEPGDSKASQTRHIPLNAEARELLKRWRAHTPETRRVF